MVPVEGFYSYMYICLSGHFTWCMFLNYVFTCYFSFFKWVTYQWGLCLAPKLDVLYCLLLWLWDGECVQCSLWLLSSSGRPLSWGCSCLLLDVWSQSCPRFCFAAHAASPVWWPLVLPAPPQLFLLYGCSALLCFAHWNVSLYLTGLFLWPALLSNSQLILGTTGCFFFFF